MIKVGTLSIATICVHVACLQHKDIEGESLERKLERLCSEANDVLRRRASGNQARNKILTYIQNIVHGTLDA